MTKSVLPSDRSLNNVVACLAALLLILPCMSEAGEGLGGSSSHHPLTLRDCIAIALGESPALEASRFDVLSAAQEVRAAQGLAVAASDRISAVPAFLGQSRLANSGCLTSGM